METFETLHKNKGEDVLPLLVVDIVAALCVACKQYPLLYRTASLANILFIVALTNKDINKFLLSQLKLFF